MNVGHENNTDDKISSACLDYNIFESLKYPVCVIGIDGILLYGNKSYKHFFKFDENEVRLDWEHPFFPEYRKRIAHAYLSALNGSEKQCFAIINSPDGAQLPVEIYLFPMYKDEAVSSILALLKIVDDRLLSFDRSTLSIISEDNFQYDNLHFEFSPMPILRINEKMDIIKCSHSLEGFLGYSCEELIDKKIITYKSIFTYDAEKIKKTISNIISGEISFQRIGEVKIATKNEEEKIVNLTMYPIVQNNQISAIEIIIEDITKIKELKNKINTINRIQLFSDITEGFLHSLNNTINVIMSETQLLLQITEKEPVVDGIQLIEESIIDIVEQIKRIQSFIGKKDGSKDEKVEPLVNVIEDSIEFSKMQFKVEDKENKKNIHIERKYFSSVYIRTDTRSLREIIISIILKVANFIHKEGIIDISLKKNNDLYLLVKIEKDNKGSTSPVLPSLVNIFSGIDIRQVAETIKLKIIEEESADFYSIKAIFPARMIIDNQNSETDDIEYKLRDLDIIIVEDEVALQKILFELFDKMGNRVFICENGKKALEEFKKKNYNLVITDYGISGITGIELAARVKEINEDTVTILLSGWTLNDIKSYKNVIDLFIPKPFKLDFLLKNISKIFNEKKGK